MINTLKKVTLLRVIWVLIKFYKNAERLMGKVRGANRLFTENQRRRLELNLNVGSGEGI
ncbi:hypothetical protein J2X61_004214 [Bacillus sp. 3255]|nr:hypothetical protein [Bacillus sp. 3255]